MKIIDKFVEFEHKHRGVSQEHAKKIRTGCEKFITYLTNKGVTSIRLLKPQMIFDFITTLGNHYSRTSMSKQCAILRHFLSYLHRHSMIPIDMSSIVVAPRIFKYESCPRFLTRVEVQKVLSVIDQETLVGKRDYAMLMLLATYGLRGIEVVRLRLDDIDWRHKKLYVKTRKSGNNTNYPLTDSVAAPVLVYLKSGRPHSTHRNIFLTTKPPFAPFTSSTCVGYQIRRYMAMVGINLSPAGTHTFRYSCAQMLLNANMPIKIIGDYLGHSLPDSTQHYTKIAITQLREVALGDGEDVL